MKKQKTSKPKSKKENPLEKLSVEEIEVIVVDGTQLAKEKAQELSSNAEYSKLGEEITAHKKKPENLKLKEEVDALKEKIKEINAKINEGLEDITERRSEIASPYTEAIKLAKENIKNGILALQKKGRVVE